MGDKLLLETPNLQDPYIQYCMILNTSLTSIVANFLALLKL